MAEINGLLDLLPLDVLESILLSLPFNTLLRCRIISRSLNDIITSLRFINSHLKQSSNISHPLFLGVNRYSPANHCSKIRLRDRIFETIEAIPMPGSLLLCYCDGMYLLQAGNKNGEFLLWNPSRQRHTAFFCPYKAKGILYGLCRSMDTAEFYIVIGYGYCYGIYSSKSRSWRKTNFYMFGDLRDSAGLSVGGVVYWDWVRKVEKRDVQCIVCFDSRDGELKILENLPEGLRDTDRIHLGCRNGQLCGWFNNVEQSRIKMWMLDGNSNWKLFMMVCNVPSSYGSVRPLFFLRDQIVLQLVSIILKVLRFYCSTEFEDILDVRSLFSRDSTVAVKFPYVDSLVFFGMLRNQPQRRCRSRRLSL